ncbi:probable carbonic anhydrase 1 at N-terminal half [Coccomyxa sp. Obi]|nr:probable carbonic anhydrase 1 at N-terminal half [Coccomyxa sp. Obi]
METVKENVPTTNENESQNSIVEDARLYPETTGKRLGQIVRFELDTPEIPPAAPNTGLGHITEEDERSYRGSDAEVRQKARQALESLLEGNARFLKGEFVRCKPDLELLEELYEEQTPVAVVLACSDSRCPPELVFDQGLGDLLVVRVAGNVVNDFVMGSIVNAVQLLGVRLVMVLGHTKCGMVARAVHHWAKHEARKLADPAAHSEAQGLQAESTPRPAAADAPPGPAEKGDGAPAAAAGRRPSAFARLCSCGGAPATAGDGEPAAPPADQSRPSSSGQSLASNSSPSQSGGGRRAGSLGRITLDRFSTNPIGAIVSSINAAVDHVASRDHGLNHVISRIHRNEEMKELGFTGLQTQDSLGITRARLAKQRLNENLTLLNQIKDMQGVEEVASQNSVLSAKAVLKGLVRSTDVAICQEVEVVAAKYDLKDGKVSVIKRGWYSGRSFYYE